MTNPYWWFHGRNNLETQQTFPWAKKRKLSKNSSPANKPILWRPIRKCRRCRRPALLPSSCTPLSPHQHSVQARLTSEMLKETKEPLWYHQAFGEWYVLGSSTFTFYSRSWSRFCQLGCGTRSGWLSGGGETGDFPDHTEGVYWKRKQKGVRHSESSCVQRGGHRGG